MVSTATIQAEVLAVVAAIPMGYVMAYGEIARRAGWPGRARLVGRVLSELPEGSTIPWWRVVNASRRISPRGLNGHDDWQKVLLQEEGVLLDQEGRVPTRYFFRDQVLSP